MPDMKNVTIRLKDQDIDELEVLLYSEYDACTIGKSGRITLYAYKAFNTIDLLSRCFSTNCDSRKSLRGLISSISAWNDRTIVLPDSMKDFTKCRIVWSKFCKGGPHWPCYLIDTDEKHVFILYISRSRFSVECSPYAIKYAKCIPYSSATVTSMMERGLEYYKELQLWDSFRDFYNAILLAKTYISFQRRNFFSTMEDCYQFLNSDIPEYLRNDSHSPHCDEYQKFQQAQSSTIVSMRNREEMRPEVSEVWQNYVHARRQRVYEYIMNGNCDKYLSKIINGKTFSERWETIQKNKLSSRHLRTWRETYINAYFNNENQCLDILEYLKQLLFRHNKGTTSSVPIQRYLRLLYDALYPEAIIRGIQKLENRPYCDADKAYRNTVLTATSDVED